MKKLIIILSMLVANFIDPAFGQSNWVMTYKSAKPINGATLGYQLGKIMAYGGIDVLNISYSTDSEYTNYNWDWENEKLYLRSKEESSFSLSGALYVPHLGGRYYLTKKLARGYVIAEGFIIVPALDYKDKGLVKYYDTGGNNYDSDSWDDSMDKDEKQETKDLLDYIGLMVGFGSEYEVAPAFSIGGEFGMRFFFNSAKTEDTDEDEWDGQVHYREISKREIKSKLMGTYTTLTLNYHF